MATSNTYITISNIPNFVQSQLVENGIRSILNRQRHRFGSPIEIRIIQSPFVTLQTAFVFYSNCTLNQEIVEHFNNTPAFGTVLSFKLVNRRNPQPTRGQSVDGAQIELIHNSNAHFMNNFNNESSINNNGSNITPVNSNNSNNINVNLALETENQANNPFISTSANIVRPIEEKSPLFLCSRCEFNFQQNQEHFEGHVNECKKKEELSMSRCLRKGNCKICNCMFLQTPVTSIFILPCGHLYHKECFSQIREHKKKCLICHENIQDNWLGSFFL